MKNVVKVLIFLIIFIILLLVSSFIFVPKSNIAMSTRTRKTNLVMGEKDNSLDALFIGDSLVYTAINPMHIWENYGYTSYDLAMSAQYLYESYNNIDKILQNQKPKIIFLETNQFFRKYKIVNVIGAEGKKIFPVFEYHNRWKDLSFDDLFKKAEYTLRDPYKGYRFMNKVNRAEDANKNYMKKKKDKKEINDLNYRYIKKIAQKCKENDIELVLLSTPSMKNCNYSKYQTIKDIAKEFNLEHVDLNLDNKLDIDWITETVDKGDHLNYLGAYKVSDFLGEYLKGKNFVDHRHDDKYSSWQEDYELYKKKIAEDSKK